MHYLIDGYNLLHAMGVMPEHFGPTGLEKARLRLLGLLHGAYGAAAAPQVTVVFDAAGARPGAPEVQNYKGILVRFAVREREADDLIEWLIGRDSAPKQLTVVSDDRRIREAARRRQCPVAGCGVFLDWLARHRRRHRPQPPQDGKPEKLSAGEAEQWVQEFAALEEEPDLKAFFAMDRFEDVEEDGSGKPGA